MNDNKHNPHQILNTFALYEVMDLLQREFLWGGERTKTVLEVLFTDIDFQKFTSKTTGFYLDVFGGILPVYFDSHSDRDERAKFENIIRLLEEKVFRSV